MNLKIDFDHVIGEEGECNRKDQGFHCVMKLNYLFAASCWFDCIVLFNFFEK